MDDPISFARKLRREQSAPERRFWGLLHPWRISGWHFRRQSPIGPYVADFVCRSIKLVFEIDGDTHYTDEGIARDEVRTAFLTGLGYRVVRFTNADVMDNPEGVFEVMLGILGEPGLPGTDKSTPT